MTRKSNVFWALPFVLGSALAWSSSAAGAERVAFNACQLLTPAEIAVVVGVPVLDGQRQDFGIDEKLAGYSSTCIWLMRDEGDEATDSNELIAGRKFVILNAMRWTDTDNRASEYLEGFRRAARSGELPKQPVVRSIGEESLWWGDGLAVRQGTLSFGVSVFPSPVSPQYPGINEEKLAELILAKLKDPASSGRMRK